MTLFFDEGQDSTDDAMTFATDVSYLVHKVLTLSMSPAVRALFY